jgi:RNA polymerase sigma factor (sigma-70 family)
MGRHRLATPDLGRIFRGETVAGLSEWQLLERYLECRDEAAFEAIVARHGPMVLGVCRRMLADRTDVEDAFQATFLVLVRRARHLGPRDAIGPWLYGVASRVAMRARSEAARRRRFQPLTPEVAVVVDQRSTADREIGEILDQELGRLPSKYRSPIVLCYLEGQTHEEAARQLKWPIGTVKGRLARARDLLQSRLVRRGLTPAVGALSLALAPDGAAAPHRELLDRTVKASLKFGLGQTTAQIVSSSITSLVEGVLTSMLLNTLKWTSPGILVGALALSGVAVMARQGAKPAAAKPADPLELAGNPPPANAINSNAGAPETLAVPKAESHGANEVAPIADMRKNLVQAALMEWEEALGQFSQLQAGPELAYHASKRLMDAEQALANGPDEKIAPTQEHLKRVRELARRRGDSAQVRAYAAEAAVWLAQANSVGAGKGEGQDSEAGTTSKPGKDPKSQMILAKLDEPVSMSFSDDTPLEDVLKYVKQATTTKTYAGIPIYIDPLGLQEAEKSMTSTVRNMDLEHVPLRRTLQLLLKQLDLKYFVDDGILCITSAQSDGRFDPAIHEPSPIMQKAEKADRGELSLTEMKDLIEVFKTRDQIKKLAAGKGEIGHNVAQADRAKEEAKQDRESMKQLLKEMRELMQVLKAERQTKTAAEGK